MKYTVEVCTYTIEDIKAAKEAGAERVEICADPDAGGTTPSYGLIEYVVDVVGIDAAVMIRPRGGDFVYSPEELEIMERDILRSAQAGAKAVVFGVLTNSGHLDLVAMKHLIAVAKEHGLEVTCHRAFDVSPDPHRFVQELVDLGVDRLLTSGQKPRAIEGLELLGELQKAVGGKLSIMPAVEITSENVEKLLDLGVTEVHTRNVETVTSAMERGANIVMGHDDYDETTRVRIDLAETRRIVEIVKRREG
ncbi:MAG: copper homeostasis protein CutC [Firmicutes bacterium]|nr:copper homeostasis protein CutC [Bacillota bacterium]